MKHHVSIPALITAVIICTSGASAQVPVFEPELAIGLTAALSTNDHEGGFQGNDTWSPSSEPRTGTIIGAIVRYSVTDRLSVNARLAFDSRPASFERELPDGLVLMPGNAEPVNQTIIDRADVEYRMVTGELFANARLLEPLPGIALAVNAGLSGSSITRGTYTRVNELIEPTDARLGNPEGLPTENNGRRIVFARNADIPGLNAMRLSIKGGAGVEVGLPLGLLVRPGVAYDFGLTSVDDSGDWTINSVIYQLDVMLRF